MKKLISLFCFAGVVSLGTSVEANNKVVVIPLGSSAGIALNQTCPLGSQMIGIGGTGNIICNTDYKSIVFVTSTSHTGALGGLTGADAICNSLAAAASLPGTYMAWLSDSTMSPSSRFTTQPNRRYVTTERTIIAYNWADLIDGNLNAPIRTDENGVYENVTGIEVWSNTIADGTNIPLNHCNDWSNSSDTEHGFFGNMTAVDEWWTDSTYGGGAPGLWRECDNYLRLYCFQQY